MESQYHSAVVASTHNPFYSPPYSLHSDQYLASPGEVDFATNFLGGSSPSYPDPHEDYRFSSSVFHRGPGDSSYHRPPESSTISISDGLDATGLGFSGNTAAAALLVDNLFPAEELALYTPHHHTQNQNQPWSWSSQGQAQAQASIHGVVAPVPVLPSPPEATFLAIKNKQVPLRSSFVHSPDPPLPTPAAMAVLLNSGARSDSQSVYDLSSSATVVRMHGAGIAGGRGGVVSVASAMSVAVATGQDMHESTSREKKHACTMCHKR